MRLKVVGWVDHWQDDDQPSLVDGEKFPNLVKRTVCKSKTNPKRRHALSYSKHRIIRG